VRFFVGQFGDVRMRALVWLGGVGLPISCASTLRLVQQMLSCYQTNSSSTTSNLCDDTFVSFDSICRAREKKYSRLWLAKRLETYPWKQSNARQQGSKYID
jgi:hypothetical protein